MTTDEIRELIQLVTETGVAELEVQRGENRVRISVATAATAVLAPAPVAAPAQHYVSAPKAEAAPAIKTPDSLVYAKSPIVGTFYESASPDSEPFVKIGEHVTPGKVLCIIESMKLMNEIEADVSGIVESKLVSNGQAVEYGESLFGIRPV
jgi:acetyl-CoA carboxylase biotin carboxyl carrier protein